LPKAESDLHGDLVQFAFASVAWDALDRGCLPTLRCNTCGSHGSRETDGNPFNPIKKDSEWFQDTPSSLASEKYIFCLAEKLSMKPAVSERHAAQHAMSL